MPATATTATGGRAAARRRAVVLLVTILGLAVLGSSLPALAVVPTLGPPDPGLGRALDVMDDLATDGRKKKSTKPKAGLPIKLGKDGRLTMLLVGSDWRPTAGGERLDVLMVATIDPTTGEAAVVSIPRDMSGIPLASGGTSGGTRVNAIYLIRHRDPKLPHAAIDEKALTKFSRDIAKFLGTQIDYWAFVRFGTYAAVINGLGGVNVDVDEEVLDSSYHHGRSRGVWFPKKDDYTLKGDPKCKPKPKKCRSALVYARSRKGTMGAHANNDYKRAERQQDIVLAGVKGVLENDGLGVALLGLLNRVRKHMATNIPSTPEAAAQLYDILAKVRLPEDNMKVLGPSTWASTGAGFTIQPKVSTIRRWVDKAFYKVKGAGRPN